MIGILTEKPSQARNFAKALGGEKGTYNGEEYIIAPSHGHLYGFKKEPNKQVAPDKAEKYSDWSLANLPWDENDFLWNYEKKPGINGKADNTAENIARTFSRCDEICIATDDDPTGEGELLAWEIISQQKIKAKKYTRMYFADEAPASIQKAFKDRKTLGYNLNCMYQDPDYKQAIFRTKWDYLSMQWSRVATRINGEYHQVLRNGRLKSAMVKMVGDQLKAVEEYVKKPFFQNRFKDENGVIYTSDKEPTYEKKEDVPQKYTSSPVVVDSKTMKKSAPPKFLDLASLSAQLAPKGIGSKQVLATYQAMYEAQIVSYPRTEDHYITEEQFKELLPCVDKIARLVGVDTKLLTHRTPRSTHIKTGMAHGANRPGTNVPSSLDALDGKYGKGAKEIYVLLARNYLATLCEDYEYEQQKGHVKKYPDFKGVANVPVKQGWKAIYGTDDVDENESGKGLGTKAAPFVYEGANPKPAAPTMKWLMKQLEKRNVGTGATRTSIYSDVTNQKTEYPLLVDKRGKITFAPCGEANYKLLPGTHIGDLSMTEHVTEQMKGVAEGKLDENTCLHEIQQMIVDDIATMQKNRGTTPAPEHKDKVTGVWKKTGKEVSFNRKWGAHEFTDEEAKKLLDGEVITFEYNGRLLSGSLQEQTYNKHKFVGFAFEKGASSTSGKKSDVPSEWSGHKFTAQEQKDLKAGKAVHATDFWSRAKQKSYSTDVKWLKVGGSYKIVPSFSKDYK